MKEVKINPLEEIKLVKIQGNGYLLNGTMSVPMADGNREYELIKLWIAEGNTPEPEHTEAEIAKQNKQMLITAVQNMMDSAAKAKGYDSILSACTYAAHPNPFQAEGQEFVAWRGAVWAKCYEILGEVEAGTRAAPTVSELLAEIATTIQTPGADNDTGS